MIIEILKSILKDEPNRKILILSERKNQLKILEDLIKETIIVYIKIQILSYNIDKQIRLKRIYPESFIHRVLLLCAKEFIKKPHLFYHNIKPIEKQYNINININNNTYI